jgi:Beta-ketoacyl synthase, N-terminal domain
MNADHAPLPPPVQILGIGAVTPLGRDPAVIAKNLAAKSPAATGLLRVGDDLLAEPAITRSMRRADRLIRMAAIAALDAWNQAAPSCADTAREQIGLIVTSGLGPHCRGFKFLDGILDAGDSDALPTDFSHSVHGAAASYIAGLLDLRGPSLTATDFEIGFEQAVLLAQTWLQQGICRRVLVGSFEEIGEPMISMMKRLLAGKESIIPGEGAVFLMLAQSDGAGIATIDAAAVPEKTDLLVTECPPIAPDAGSSPEIAAMRTVTFTPYFGHSATSSAMQLLGALLSILYQRSLGKMITVAPDSNESPVVDNATTLRTSCGKVATIYVSRT